MQQHPIFPYPPSRAGYWAPITSTLNWCEEVCRVLPLGSHASGIFGFLTPVALQDYYASFYLAEFVNALTNCLFLWLGVKGLLSCRRNGHDSIFQSAFLGYLTVGFGSFLFHATLKCTSQKILFVPLRALRPEYLCNKITDNTIDPMQLVDELSMIYTTCLVCYATFSYSKPTKTRVLLALFLLALAIVITLYYHYIQNPIFHQNAYALLTAIVLLRSMWVMEAALRPSWRNKGLERNQQLHSYEDMRDLKILHTMWVMVAYGLATFLGGFAIWNLDNVFCSRLRGWRRKIGLPWGILLEGHGWWYVLTPDLHICFCENEKIHDRKYMPLPLLQSLTAKNRHLMTGIGAYMYIVWGIWLRHCLNGRQEEYQLQWPRIYSFPDVVRVSNQGKRSTNGSTKLPAAHKPYHNGMAKKIN